ncbi:MAG: S9 family peptidase, partial [Actinobacteria bacterium]|nr:S9 family peptidase [Actinomycetota bacterium]
TIASRIRPGPNRPGPRCTEGRYTGPEGRCGRLRTIGLRGIRSPFPAGLDRYDRQVLVPDLRDYLEIRSAAPVNFSPDGSKLLVRSNLSGTVQLYRVPSTGGELRPVTDFHEPVNGAYLPTRDEIVLMMDEGGNERHQLYLLGDDGADLRKLVHDPDFIHRVGGVSLDGRFVAFESNRRNGVDFDVYVMPVGEGAPPRAVFSPGGWCNAAGFSPDGRWLAVIRRTERNADNDLYLVDLSDDSVVHVAPHEDDAVFGSPAWLPDSSAFFFSTDCGRDRAAIARYELAGRTWDYVLERHWDSDCLIDRAGTHLLVTSNEDGCTRAELFDPTSLTVQGEVELPGRGVAEFTFSPDGRRLAYGFASAIEQGDVWIYDVESAMSTRLTTSPRAVPTSAMVEPELHRFPSFDGEQVPVYVYVPTGEAVEPFPVIVLVHGGPEVQFQPGFNPLVQYFIARGYAVAAPNVRGSTGYGKRYHHLDDVDKRLDSVADLAGLHDWLATDGRFDASRAAIWGGSYGGYMVLAALAFQPQRWSAGVSLAGISSLVTFLENTSTWRRSFREREYGRLDTDREVLEAASPLTHLDRMRAPLFLIHGANDPRVPVTEAEQIHQVLSVRGIRCELLIFSDEGHGLARLHNRIEAYGRATGFLDEVLQAR